MADKCRELPRGPRGALLSSFPPCLPSHHKLERGQEKKKTSEVPDTSPTGSTDCDNEENEGRKNCEIFRFATDV
jgi:hypothetical protein